MFGQEFKSENYYLIKTRQGETKVGYFLKAAENQFIFTDFGRKEWTILSFDVEKAEPISLKQAWRLAKWPVDPLAYRSFVMENGLPKPKGQLEYKTYMGVFHQVNYAFSSWFSLGIGYFWKDLVVSEKRPLWISPMFNIPIVDQKLFLSLGTHMNYLSGKYEGFRALHRGFITYTYQDWRFSVGATFEQNNYFYNEKKSFLSLYNAIAYRFSPRTSVLGESSGYFFRDLPVQYGIVGFKTSGKAFSFDYGIAWQLLWVSPPSGNAYSFFPIPWLGLSYRFQTKK